MAPLQPAPPSLPRGIWILGFVSLLMDISSELIHSLLPIYLVSVLGASALMIGLIEGTAKATAPMVKVFSGALSDYLGKRKGLAILGYGLGAITKPVFALATGTGPILASRLVDRIGKGIRGAPRDALVADLVPASQRGAAYGLRKSLDMVGAFAGPLLAIGLMLLWDNDYQAVFWVAVVPGFLAIALLAFGLQEPEQSSNQHRTNPIKRANLKQLNRAYWGVVAVGIVFTLARFSEAFLLLHGEQGGLAAAWLPAVLVVMSLAVSLSAFPFGKLSDRIPAPHLLSMGLLTLVLADLVLVVGTHWLWTLLGAAVWGLHLGMTQGLLSKMVADTAPKHLRGTAFGVFNLFSGAALFVANAGAGLLWLWGGPELTYAVGAGIALLAMAALWFAPDATATSDQAT